MSAQAVNCLDARTDGVSYGPGWAKGSAMRGRRTGSSSPSGGQGAGEALRWSCPVTGGHPSPAATGATSCGRSPWSPGPSSNRSSAGSRWCHCVRITLPAKALAAIDLRRSPTRRGRALPGLRPQGDHPGVAAGSPAGCWQPILSACACGHGLKEAAPPRGRPAPPGGTRRPRQDGCPRPTRHG